MIQNRSKENKIAIIILLGLVGSWILYALFADQLIKAIYEERSLEVLNKLIVGRARHPLEYYFELVDRLFLLFFRWSATGVLSFIFLFSIWSGRNIAKKWFLCLIILLSLCQISRFINFKTMNDLFIHDDHPKHYSITVENANLLIKHGTPFGFNHNFQGGIPAFYLRSCFLELIPFAFFLGDRLGYQVMLVNFIILIPVSLFFLVLELTKNENIAKLASFISTFQVGLWPLLWWGLVPAIVAIPLSFLSLLFFLKYLYGNKYHLLPLLFFAGILAYTNAAIFAISWIFFIIFFIYKLFNQKKFSSDLKRFISFCALNFLTCLPLCYNLLNYASFLKISVAPLVLSNFALALSIKDTLLLRVILFSSTLLFLFCSYRNISNPKEKLILRKALLFSLVILSLQPLWVVPNARIFIYKISMIFMSYITVFNLSLFLLLKINKAGKIFAIIILLFTILNQYPLSNSYLETVNTVSEIDNEINALISPEDFVLFENCAHINPAKNQKEYTRGKGYSHWLTYLQRDLGVKFFSHIGNDPHPHNNLRHMYITNGLYKGRPLGRDSQDEFITLLRDWGVNKTCVWSSTAKQFFNKSEYFKLLGKAKEYTCFIATYEVLPEVRIDKPALGKIVEETPFSFTVYLQNISGKQTVTINKNYFNFWRAFNEKGEKVSLRKCKQKICFEVANNGPVFFKYQKNILLNLISLLVLVLVLISDFLGLRQFN